MVASKARNKKHYNSGRNKKCSNKYKQLGGSKTSKLTRPSYVKPPPTTAAPKSKPTTIPKPTPKPKAPNPEISRLNLFKRRSFKGIGQTAKKLGAGTMGGLSGLVTGAAVGLPELGLRAAKAFGSIPFTGFQTIYQGLRKYSAKSNVKEALGMKEAKVLNTEQTKFTQDINKFDTEINKITSNPKLTFEEKTDKIAEIKAEKTKAEIAHTETVKNFFKTHKISQNKKFNTSGNLIKIQDAEGKDLTAANTLAKHIEEAKSAYFDKKKQEYDEKQMTTKTGIQYTAKLDAKKKANEALSSATEKKQKFNTYLAEKTDLEKQIRNDPTNLEANLKQLEQLKTDSGFTDAKKAKSGFFTSYNETKHAKELQRQINNATKTQIKTTQNAVKSRPKMFSNISAEANERSKNYNKTLSRFGKRFSDIWNKPIKRMTQAYGTSYQSLTGEKLDYMTKYTKEKEAKKQYEALKKQSEGVGTFTKITPFITSTKTVEELQKRYAHIPPIEKIDESLTDLKGKNAQLLTNAKVLTPSDLPDEARKTYYQNMKIMELQTQQRKDKIQGLGELQKILSEGDVFNKRAMASKLQGLQNDYLLTGKKYAEEYIDSKTGKPKSNLTPKEIEKQKQEIVDKLNNQKKNQLTPDEFDILNKKLTVLERIEEYNEYYDTDGKVKTNGIEAMTQRLEEFKKKLKTDAGLTNKEKQEAIALNALYLHAKNTGELEKIKEEITYVEGQSKKDVEGDITKAEETATAAKKKDEETAVAAKKKDEETAAAAKKKDEETAAAAEKTKLEIIGKNKKEHDAVLENIKTKTEEITVNQKEIDSKTKEKTALLTEKNKYDYENYVTKNTAYENAKEKNVIELQNVENQLKDLNLKLTNLKTAIPLDQNNIKTAEDNLINKSKEKLALETNSKTLEQDKTELDEKLNKNPNIKDIIALDTNINKLNKENESLENKVNEYKIAEPIYRQKLNILTGTEYKTEAEKAANNTKAQKAAKDKKNYNNAKAKKEEQDKANNKAKQALLSDPIAKIESHTKKIEELDTEQRQLEKVNEELVVEKGKLNIETLRLEGIDTNLKHKLTEINITKNNKTGELKPLKDALNKIINKNTAATNQEKIDAAKAVKAKIAEIDNINNEIDGLKTQINTNNNEILANETKIQENISKVEENAEATNKINKEIFSEKAELDKTDALITPDMKAANIAVQKSKNTAAAKRKLAENVTKLEELEASKTKKQQEHTKNIELLQAALIAAPIPTLSATATNEEKIIHFTDLEKHEAANVAIKDANVKRAKEELDEAKLEEAITGVNTKTLAAGTALNAAETALKTSKISQITADKKLLEAQHLKKIENIAVPEAPVALTSPTPTAEATADFTGKDLLYKNALLAVANQKVINAEEMLKKAKDEDAITGNTAASTAAEAAKGAAETAKAEADAAKAEADAADKAAKALASTTSAATTSTTIAAPVLSGTSSTTAAPIVVVPPAAADPSLAVVAEPIVNLGFTTAVSTDPDDEEGFGFGSGGSRKKSNSKSKKYSKSKSKKYSKSKSKKYSKSKSQKYSKSKSNSAKSKKYSNSRKTRKHK